MELSKGPFIVVTHPSPLHLSLIAFCFSLQMTELSHALLTSCLFSHLFIHRGGGHLEGDERKGRGDG